MPFRRRRFGRRRMRFGMRRSRGRRRRRLLVIGQRF